MLWESGTIAYKNWEIDWEWDKKKRMEGKTAKLIAEVNYIRVLNIFFFNNIAISVHELKSYRFLENPAY